MKVADKLAYFKDMVNREAEERSKLLSAQTEEKFLSAVEAAETEAERRADRRVRAELYRIGIEKNRRVLAAAMAAKKSAVELRSHLINDVFGGVAKMAEDFTRTDGYGAWLKANVPELAKPFPNAKVIAMERDRAIFEEIAAESPGTLTFEYTGDDFIGGFKIFLPERSAILDYTFKNRINGERKSFNRLRSGFEGLRAREE